jgi:ribokinase
MKTVVNPAPAQAFPPELLVSAPILTPNAEELPMLTGAADLEGGVSSLLAAGAAAVVVTLGADGALLAEPGRRRRIPALAVDVVDTTGAGDTFAGVLAAWIASGHDLDAAVDAANRAAGLSVTRNGARDGMPSRSAIENALRA